MLTLPPSVKIYVASSPVSMHMSFDGLSAMVRSVLGSDPLSGHLFVFHNRRGDMLRLLWWSSGGYCLFSKRLERGRFCWSRALGAETSHVEMDATDLALILEGIDLRDARRRRRWSPRRDEHAIGLENAAAV